VSRHITTPSSITSATKPDIHKKANIDRTKRRNEKCEYLFNSINEEIVIKEDQQIK
jgi:hypothetical protein